MRITLLSCVLAAALAGLGAAQDTKPGQDRKKVDDKPVITVTGCVDGSWLQVRNVDPVGSYAERYKLRGSKQLMKEIAGQYNRHLLEVTGAVTDVAGTTHRGKTVDVGKKTRIHVGAKDIPQVPTGDDPTLDVRSYRELKDSCR